MHLFFILVTCFWISKKLLAIYWELFIYFIHKVLLEFMLQPALLINAYTISRYQIKCAFPINKKVLTLVRTFSVLYYQVNR